MLFFVEDLRDAVDAQWTRRRALLNFVTQSQLVAVVSQEIRAHVLGARRLGAWKDLDHMGDQGLGAGAEIAGEDQLQQGLDVELVIFFFEQMVDAAEFNFEHGLKSDGVLGHCRREDFVERLQDEVNETANGFLALLLLLKLARGQIIKHVSPQELAHLLGVNQSLSIPDGSTVPVASRLESNRHFLPLQINFSKSSKRKNAVEKS